VSRAVKTVVQKMENKAPAERLTHDENAGQVPGFPVHGPQVRDGCRVNECLLRVRSSGYGAWRMWRRPSFDPRGLSTRIIPKPWKRGIEPNRRAAGAYVKTAQDCRQSNPPWIVSQLPAVVMGTSDGVMLKRLPPQNGRWRRPSSPPTSHRRTVAQSNRAGLLPPSGAQSAQ